MSGDILESKRERDGLLTRFIKEQHPALYTEYCKMRNKTQRDIKKAKSEYLHNKIDEHKDNPKKLWEQLKTLGYSTKSNGKAKVVLNIDGSMCFDSSKVANHINMFYTTIASKLVEKLPTSTNKFSVSNLVLVSQSTLGKVSA